MQNSDPGGAISGQSVLRAFRDVRPGISPPGPGLTVIHRFYSGSESCVFTVDTHGPETHHSTFATSRCTATVERIIMKLVCKMISTVDYHVFGYEITMYYYAIHWEHWGAVRARAGDEAGEDAQRAATAVQSLSLSNQNWLCRPQSTRLYII